MSPTTDTGYVQGDGAGDRYEDRWDSERKNAHLLLQIQVMYGVMLLVIDMRIDGTVRERMLVSCYRYRLCTGCAAGDRYEDRWDGERNNAHLLPKIQV